MWNDWELEADLILKGHMAGSFDILNTHDDGETSSVKQPPKTWWRWVIPLSDRLRRAYIFVLVALAGATFVWMLYGGIFPGPSPHFPGTRKHNMTTFTQIEEDGLPFVDTHLGELPVLTLAQKLSLFNKFGLISANFGLSATSHDQLVNLTIQRLQLRVTERLSRAGLYNVRLNQATPRTEHSLYVAHGIIPGGLGNWMFNVASMFGVARSNNRRPALLKVDHHEAYFEGFVMERRTRTQLFGDESDNALAQAQIGESAAGRYTQSMGNVTNTKGPRNVMLAGYMQAWRYFDEFRADIRSMFTFSQTVYRDALRAIEQKINAFVLSLNNGTTFQDGDLPVLVGIHVRRGDMTDPGQMKFGHKTATEDYLLRAALHFQRTSQSVIFIVISNDISYCKELYKEPNFLFMDGNSEAVDMAILSLMDKIILSIGTFGWWGAYLSDAKEIYYYRNWPREGSAFKAMINATEYFLPSWTAFE
ncbi:putative Galactoside [Hypsibius exemplaris]|uniref:L-Fucosyltransferase n=1 Tax=Hypsibius exemplaris TaxID=2072580 RepID=A0A1W0WNC3_HYPEX|nr:putative Galactoside [Hypsibius exemplaris]